MYIGIGGYLPLIPRKVKGKQIMKIKRQMKKILATTMAFALALSGAFMLGITSNAQEYTNDTTGRTITVEDSVNFNIPEATLYAGTDFKELNHANLDTDYCNTSFWIYNTLEEARERDISKAISSYRGVTVEEGKDYYLNVSVSAGDNTGDTFVIGNHYFGTNTTSFSCTNGEIVEVNLKSPHTESGFTGLTDTVSYSGIVIVKVTGKANPSAIVPSEPQAETPAEVVEEAPAVEPQVEATPVAETEAPAQETVKATNTAPKTGDTLPILPFVVIGLGTVIGSGVILTKRFS